MKTKEIIGIDVSKLTIDVCIQSTQQVLQFKNNNTGFKQMLKWGFKNTTFAKEEILIVFEHTGMYSHNVSVFLTDENISFCMVSGLEIKRSMGIVRGKDDAIDAKRIALYGYRLRDELQPTVIATKQLLALKNLMSLRNKLVKQRAGYKATLKEQKLIYKKTEHQIIFSVQQKLIVVFTKEIGNIDSKIKAIIVENQALKSTYNLITSVTGIGMQTALVMLIYTDCFSKFDNWRKFASYCGTAPFPYQSGTSINGRTKVSHLANKKIKSILTMCAISAIQHNAELKRYYEKKVGEGKNKMSIINAVRNKLISRVFAVVKRQTPYVDTFRFAS